MQQDTNVVYIARVKGTAYEMGYAYGQMYGEQTQKNLENLLGYLYSKVDEFLSKFGVSEPTIRMIFA